MYYENWEIFASAEAIEELEEAERMVISDEELIASYYTGKVNRAWRRLTKAAMKQKDRIKTRNWQKTADSYKKTSKKKGYNLKMKGYIRKDLIIVPSNSLGWDKVNLAVMGKKISGVKLGYIFNVT